MSLSGEDSVYQQGLTSVALQVIPGRERYDIDSSGEIRLDSKSRDFTFFSADLKSGETVLVPKRGDKITLTDRSETYELQMGMKYNDSCNLQWRATGKLVS